MSWAVATTPPRSESKAVENVSRLGLNIFFPKIKNKKIKQQRVEPLFPRYFFVEAEGRWRDLLSTVGVSGIVMSGIKPAIVPDRVIQEIKVRCDRDSFYLFPQPDRFKRGQSVRVVAGPYSDSIVIYKSMLPYERVEVLMYFMGAWVRGSLKNSDLAEV